MSDRIHRPMHEPNDVPDVRRESKRQQAWAKREARRVLCQEQADALTELGIPAAVRGGWVVLLDPVGLVNRAPDRRGDPCPCPWCRFPHWERELLGQDLPQRVTTKCGRCGATASFFAEAAILDWHQCGATAATLPAPGPVDPEPHSGKGEPSNASGGRTAACGTYWGSHGCYLPLGHEGACFCGTWEDSCCQYDRATNAVRFNSAEDGEPIQWSDWYAQGRGDTLHPNPPDYPATQWTSEGEQG